MSFKYATPGNIWLFVFSAVVVIFALLGPKMEQKSYRLTKRVLLLLFAGSTIFYAVVSMLLLGLWGRGLGTLGRLPFMLSLSSPLIMLVCLVSIRWACVLMWTVFLFVHSFLSYINWPSVYGIVTALSFDWPLWTTALFLVVVAIQDRKRSRTHAVLNPIADISSST